MGSMQEMKKFISYTLEEVEEIKTEVQRLVAGLRPGTDILDKFRRDNHLVIVVDDREPCTRLSIRQSPYGVLRLYVTWSITGLGCDVAQLRFIAEGCEFVLNYDWKQQIDRLLGDGRPIAVRYYKEIENVQ